MNKRSQLLNSDMLHVNIISSSVMCFNVILDVLIICVYVFCFSTTNTCSKAESIQTVYYILSVLYLPRVIHYHDKYYPLQNNNKMCILRRVQCQLHQLYMSTITSYIENPVTQVNTLMCTCGDYLNVLLLNIFSVSNGSP